MNIPRVRLSLRGPNGPSVSSPCEGNAIAASGFEVGWTIRRRSALSLLYVKLVWSETISDSSRRPLTMASRRARLIFMKPKTTTRVRSVRETIATTRLELGIPLRCCCCSMAGVKLPAQRPSSAAGLCWRPSWKSRDTTSDKWSTSSWADRRQTDKDQPRLSFWL